MKRSRSCPHGKLRVDVPTAFGRHLLVADYLANRKLELVLVDWTSEGPPVSVVYPATLRISPKVRVFADFAAELLLQTRRKVDEFLASA